MRLWYICEHMESKPPAPRPENATFAFIEPVTTGKRRLRKDRPSLSEKELAQARERARLDREARRERGEFQVTAFLPIRIVEQIDVLKIQHDLPNRSATFKLVLERLLANPAIIEELGL